MRLLPIFALALAAAAPAKAADINDATAVALARPQELVVDKSLSQAARAALLKPVDAFYGFWENGSGKLLARALSPGFTDHTLPPGRPKGPTGPAVASRSFRAAVPDLRMTVTQRLVVGDRVVSHLRFTAISPACSRASEDQASRWASSRPTSSASAMVASPTTGTSRTI